MRDQIRQAVLAVKREQGFRFRPMGGDPGEGRSGGNTALCPGVRPEDVLLMMDITGESPGQRGVPADGAGALLQPVSPSRAWRWTA